MKRKKGEVDKTRIGTLHRKKTENQERRGETEKKKGDRKTGERVQREIDKT